MACTIKDLARKVGVSYATVSRALNNRPGVREEIRKAVLRAAREMDYRPHAAARSLVTRESRTIALIVPDITNPFYPAVAKGVEEQASRFGYRVILCNTGWNEEKEQSMLELLQERSADGLILAPAGSNPAVEQFIAAGAPVVVLSNFRQELSCSQVIIDNVRGAYLAVRHLLELGHRRIGFIGGPPQAKSAPERLQGYRLALQEAGIAGETALVRPGAYTWESGYHEAQILFREPGRPTAVFAANDLLALGVLQAAEEAGMAVPADLAVVGFDDIPFAAYHNVQLSTVSQPKQRLGELAAQLLLEELQDRTRAKRQLVIQPTLVVRRTCGAYLRGGQNRGV